MKSIRHRKRRDMAFVWLLLWLVMMTGRPLPAFGQGGSGSAGDTLPTYALTVNAFQRGSADAALIMLDFEVWRPRISADLGSWGAAGTHTFRVKSGRSLPQTLAILPVEAILPDDGSVSLWWSIWSDDPVLIDGARHNSNHVLSEGDGNISDTFYQITTIVPVLEILQPSLHADYDLTESTYTTTPPIPFQARLVPDDVSWWEDIHWRLDLEYDTTKSRGKWTSSRTFSTKNNAIHEEQYASEGGKVTVTATVQFPNAPMLTAQREFTITGIDIPDDVITSHLISAYSGATPNLLTGVAAVETEGVYNQFRSLSKYDVTDLWPNESIEFTNGEHTDGSHIGLMQVAIRETGETSIKARISAAWNWLTNIQVALDEHFNPALGRSQQIVNRLRAKHSRLPELTDEQHENNALSIYRMGWTYPECFYYIPNDSYTNWIENTNNVIGVDYADDVRDNLR